MIKWIQDAEMMVGHTDPNRLKYIIFSSGIYIYCTKHLSNPPALFGHCRHVLRTHASQSINILDSHSSSEHWGFWFIWIFFRKLFLGISSFFFAQRLHCHCCRLLSPCHYGRFPFSSAKPVMATSAGLMVYYTLLVIYKKNFLKKVTQLLIKKASFGCLVGSRIRSVFVNRVVLACCIHSRSLLAFDVLFTEMDSCFCPVHIFFLFVQQFWCAYLHFSADGSIMMFLCPTWT